jgi:hypothetical protein
VPNRRPNEVFLAERKRVEVELRHPDHGAYLGEIEIELGPDRRIRPLLYEGREWLFSHREQHVDERDEPAAAQLYVFTERQPL